MGGAVHPVMARVPGGQRPTSDEALEQLAHLRDHEGGARSLGRAYLKDTKPWRDHACTGVAAE